VLLGLLCSVVASCGDSDDGISPPIEPPPILSLSDLFGDVLLNADGDSIDTDTISNKSVIAIYFEGYWCSSCAAFTPQLMSTYEELTQDGKSFEVVLVSFDVNRAELLGHMQDTGMLWLAVLPDGGRVGALAQRYAVQFIPTLVVIDSEGNTITMSGRDDVAAKGAQAFDDWVASSSGM
jgi:thiol-disulfide isomerase/thioredoxin